jgi:Alpha-2-macroglobulin bait region domain
VTSKHEMTYLSCRIFACNQLVDYLMFPVSNEKTFKFEIVASHKMFPKAHIVVFYINDEGFMISDKVTINFEKELSNSVGVLNFIFYFYCSINLSKQLNLQISKTKVKPGEDLEISLTGRPNSFVGLLGIDQSILFLKKGNDIQPSTILEELEKFHKPNVYNYCVSIDYRNCIDELKKSEAIIITNVKNKPKRDMRRIKKCVGKKMHCDVEDAAPWNSANNKINKPKIRKDFPETWIFDSFEFDEEYRKSNILKNSKINFSISFAALQLLK